MIKRLRDFARTHPSVVVVPGTWQEQLVNCARGSKRGKQHAQSIAASTPAGWAMRRFDFIFFDDFPLPIADKHLQQQLGSAGTRWDMFLRCCVREDLLARGSRVSGYLARPFVPQDNTVFRTKLTSIRVTVPSNCPYFPYKAAIIPIFTFADASSSKKVYDDGSKSGKLSLASRSGSGDVGTPTKDSKKRTACAIKQKHSESIGTHRKRPKLVLPKPIRSLQKDAIPVVIE